MPLITVDAARALIADPPPSRHYLYRVAASGALPSYRLAGRLMFDPDDIAAFIASRRSAEPAPAAPVRRATVSGNIAAARS